MKLHKNTGIHRIQIDFEIEALSHEEAVQKVMDWICPKFTDVPDGTTDLLVREKNKEVCKQCQEDMIRNYNYAISKEQENG